MVENSRKQTNSDVAQAPIGIFDSGVGGFTVLRHIVAQLPHENVIYIADQANVPYGEKPAATIHHLSEQITHSLLAHNCKTIVVACNTATAAALSQLRADFDVPFVGMEPAVKPGALATKTGVVGILATAGTFQSQRYAILMKRYADQVQVLENPCNGLVDLIESGRINDDETTALLRTIITPMLDAGADTFVLGCTHYPFIAPTITKIAGEITKHNVTIIDPAPAVARHLHTLLQQCQRLNQSTEYGRITLLTTGDKKQFNRQITVLLGWKQKTTFV